MSWMVLSVLLAVSPLQRAVPPRTARPEAQPAQTRWRLRRPPPSPGGRVLTVRCPRAYVGVLSDLLPSGWRGGSDQVKARLTGTRVRGGWLGCEYRLPAAGRQFSVERAVPYGYTCRRDGAAAFRCEANAARER